MSKNRIPASELSHVNTWAMPEMAGPADKPSLHFQALAAVQPVVNAETVAASPQSPKMTVGQLTAGELADLSEQIYQEVYQQAYEEGLQAGKKQGLHDGQLQGRADAYQQYESQLQAELLRVSQLAEQFSQTIEQRDRAFSQSLAGLVSHLAEAVLHRELSVQQTQIETIVELCLAKLAHDVERVDIFVNPQDVQLLQKHKIYQDDYRIHPDSQLAVGSCRVSDGLTMAEYLVSEEFKALVEEVFQQHYFAEDDADTERRLAHQPELGGENSNAI